MWRNAVLSVLSGVTLIALISFVSLIAVLTGGAVFTRGAVLSVNSVFAILSVCAGRLHAERNPGLTFIIGNLPLVTYGIDTKSWCI